MTAAALRHPLQHQTGVDLPDGMGGISRTWLTVDRLWGAIETLSAAPSLSEERPIATLAHRITVRAPNTLAPGDRLVMGTRVFHVQAVADPDGRGRFSRCRCQEEQA
ncbi:head-tail adaptor protein [Aquabacter sp. CN5-332]|uniref:head-tail adaptor protein n=1 Tax=Aquabacter sp. CN5-332 TaxID=3156608 RepID=UPI0032B5613A